MFLLPICSTTNPALGIQRQVKKLLAQAIKQSSDPEVLLLYRLYRAL
jgi:hypothetical protein